jgi:hypothetical protein
MAERMQDGGGTKVEQAGQAGQARRERPEPAEPERRPTYRTLDEQQGRLTEDDSKLYEGLSDRWLDEGVVAVIGAVLCVAGVAVMGNVVGLV